jgi:Uma2 family endonuclease
MVQPRQQPQPYPNAPLHPQSHPPRPPWETLPTMYDLPSEDPEEPGLPDEFHEFQPQLLRETCCPPTYDRDRLFIATDLNLYYDVDHPLWHKRPDWFLVLNKAPATEQGDLRWSYVMWQEGAGPFLVVELLSPGTEAEDLGQTLRAVDTPPTKWQVYEQILRVPYYVLFDRYRKRFRLFRLMGSRYEEIVLYKNVEPSEDEELELPRFWLEELGLGLGVWEGDYAGVVGLWLRWHDAAGEWLPTPQERAEQQRLRAEQEQQRAEAQRLRAEQEAQRAVQAERQMQDMQALLQQYRDRFGDLPP